MSTSFRRHGHSSYGSTRRARRAHEHGGTARVPAREILAAHERLPETWPVQGTTGYEFAALTTSWLVCNEYETRMTRRYRQFSESDATFEQIAYESRRLVMRSSLAAEVEVLATQLDRIDAEVQTEVEESYRRAEASPWPDASDEMQAAVEYAARNAETRGAKVTEARLPQICADAFKAHGIIQEYEAGL